MWHIVTFWPFKCRNYQQMLIIKWFISRFLTKYPVDFQWDKSICAFLCAYKTCKNIPPALQHWLQFLSLGSFNPWTFLVLSVLSACVAEAAPFRTRGSAVVSPYRLTPSSHEHGSRFSFSRSFFVTRFFRLLGPPEEKDPSFVTLFILCGAFFSFSFTSDVMSLHVSGGCVININYRFYVMELITNYSMIVVASLLLYSCMMYVHSTLHLSPLLLLLHPSGGGPPI